jgi:YegS/Rv2252/BmrU family lipid kinase
LISHHIVARYQSVIKKKDSLNHLPRVIYNPAAGKGSAGEHLAAVQAKLAERGFAHELVQTAGAGDALRLAREAAEAGRELVVAAGGDGTINEVVNGLMTAQVDGRPRPALGVIPIGSGNDFAFGAGIPAELDDALDVLVRGSRRVMDVGRVTGGDFPAGRYFGNGVGLGFDTVVGFEAAKIKWLHGAASYLAGLVRTIFLYAKGPVYEIVLDDGQPARRAYLMISVMNGRRMGGAFLMAPDSRPDDGAFDLCLAGYVPQIKMLPLAARFLKGTQAEHPEVRMTRARKVSIRALEGVIPAHADGETICVAGSGLVLELLPAALEVVTRLQ